MAFDAYLTFASSNTVALNGESTRVGFEKSIEIKEFDFEVENSVHIGSAASGAGAGKVMFNPFTIKKLPDVSSPMLFQYCSAGQHFENVTITVNKAGGAASVAYLKFSFSLVFIKSISWDVDTSNDTPGETVKFEYGTLEIQYTPQKVDGSAGSAVVGGWNRIQNAKSPT